MPGVGQAGVFPWSQPMPHTHQNVGQGGKLSEYSDVFNLADTIADVLTNHTKVVHDALAINADQVDGEEAAAIVTEARVGAVLTKAIVDALAVNAGQVDGVEGAEILQRDGSVALTANWNTAACAILPKDVRVVAGGAFALGEVVNSLRLRYDANEIAAIYGVSNAIAGLKISKAIIGAFELNTLVANNKVPDSDLVDGIHIPNTIANVLTNHTKAVHDALAIALLAANITLGAGGVDAILNGAGNLNLIALGGTGNVVLSAPASDAPACDTMVNNSVSFEIDQTGHNLYFRIKYSDGTLKSGNVALT